VPHRSSGCSGLDFQAIFPENDKTVSVTSLSRSLKECAVALVWVNIQVTMQDASNIPVSHASRLNVPTCRSPWTAAYGRQHSGNVLSCANLGRPTSWLFTGDRALIMRLPYPLTDFIWRWGFMSIHFMVKSTLSHYKGPRPNKHFHISPAFHVD
jgi:hypothetical protein